MTREANNSSKMDGLEESLNHSLEEIYRRAEEASSQLHQESEALDQEFQRRMHTYHALRREEWQAESSACSHCPPPKTPSCHSNEHRRRRRRGFFRGLRLLCILLMLLVLLLAGLYLWPKVRAAASFGDQFSVLSELPAGVEELMPDPEMGYTVIDFQNAILGETRERSALVVREQDIQVDSQISQALVNFSIFEKTKIVHTFGTGIYTVDLSKVASEGIEVDLDNKHITVTIPRAELRYVEIDPEKTTFEDTDRAILAFGDITLTSEQQQTLQASVQQTMREHLLEAEQMEAADDLAREKVYELLHPVVQAVSSEFTLLVRQSS